MERFQSKKINWAVTGLLTITIVVLETFLTFAKPGFSRQGKGPPPVTPVIAAPSVKPDQTYVGSQTFFVATVTIDEPTLDPASVQLMRIDPNETVTSIKSMRDDGKDGDAQPGDKMFSTQFSLRESNQGILRLAVTARFRGRNLVISSSSTAVAVINPAGYSLRDMSASSAAVIRAEVADQQTSIDEHSEIITHIILRVKKVLKGQVATTATVQLQGGVFGNIHSYSPGTPFFTSGEEVVILLDGPDAGGLYSLPYLALGTYHIRPTSEGEELAVIDKGYRGVAGVTARNPTFNEFLINSANNNIRLSQLYMELGVSP